MSLQLASCCCYTAGNPKMYSSTVIPSNSNHSTFQLSPQNNQRILSPPTGISFSTAMQPVRVQSPGLLRTLPKEALVDLLVALLERKSFEELLKTLHEIQSNRAYGLGAKGSSNTDSVLRIRGSHCGADATITIEGRKNTNPSSAAHAHPMTPNHPSHPGHTEESNLEAVPGLEHGQKH